MFSRAQQFEAKKLMFIICMHLCDIPYHLPFLCEQASWESNCQWYVGISQVWQTPFYFLMFLRGWLDLSERAEKRWNSFLTLFDFL